MHSLAIQNDPRIKDVSCTGEKLTVELCDGRSISVPTEWYPRLKQASPKELKNWCLSRAGFGIHWPDIDEDISVEGLLAGRPAPSR